MGKLNEIQEEVKQSFGSNSFTTTIKETTVEFDSTKDSFTFLDPVNVPSLKVNGQEVSGGNADWDAVEGEAGYIENKPFYDAEIDNVIANFETDTTDWTYFDWDVIPEVGKTYKVQVEGQIVEISAVQGTSTIIMLNADFGEGCGLSLDYNSIGYGSHNGRCTGNNWYTGNVKIITKMRVLKKIDSKYLSQANWNQSDETASDYIKNRPFYDAEVTVLDSQPINSTGGFDGGRVAVTAVGAWTVGQEVTVETAGGVFSGAITNAGDTMMNYVTLGTNGSLMLANFDGAAYAMAQCNPALVSITIKTGGAVGIPDKYVPQLGGVKFKIESGALKASIDGGITWKTITLS